MKLSKHSVTPIQLENASWNPTKTQIKNTKKENKNLLDGPKNKVGNVMTYVCYALVCKREQITRVCTLFHLLIYIRHR